MQIIQFRSRLLREDSAERHAELTADELSVRRDEAWETFLRATKTAVTAQDGMNGAHKKWLALDMQLFAARAAERLKP